MLLDLLARREALPLDRATGRTTEYARFPDLRPCGSVPLADDCRAGRRRAADAELPPPWLPDGSLLVTSLHQQDVIWRVRPASGGPRLCNRRPLRCSSEEYSYAGIVLSADRRTVYVTQASNFGSTAAPDPNQGKLYAVPILPDGDPGPIATVWTSPGILDLPDGFAISRAGNFYVALVGLPAQVVKLGLERSWGASACRCSASTTSPIAFDSPSSARFLGTRILVANQARSSAARPTRRSSRSRRGSRGGQPGTSRPAPAAARWPRPLLLAPAVLPRLRVQARPSAIRAGRRDRPDPGHPGLRRDPPRRRQGDGPAPWPAPAQRPPRQPLGSRSPRGAPAGSASPRRLSATAPAARSSPSAMPAEPGERRAARVSVGAWRRRPSRRSDRVGGRRPGVGDRPDACRWAATALDHGRRGPRLRHHGQNRVDKRPPYAPDGAGFDEADAAFLAAEATTASGSA